MNQETLARAQYIQDIQATQDRRTKLAKSQTGSQETEKSECCTGSCEVHWKPVKATTV